MITFEPGQTELEYEMEIVDDDEWEPDEEFYVKVSFGRTAQSPVLIMTMHTYPETEKKVLSKNSFGAS